MRLIDYPTRDTLDGSEFLYAAKPGVGNSYKVTPTALTEFIFKQAGQLNNVQAQDARNASLIAQSGEQAAVPYAAGLSMTSTLQRVSYLNDVYAPLGSALPFSTTGIWANDRTKLQVKLGALAKDLAASSTLPIGGFSVSETQSILDYSLPKTNFAELRIYNGRASAIRISASGIGGLFQADLTDTTSADDGGWTIVDALGRRWKRIDNVMNIRHFGALCDGVTDDSAAWNAAISAAAARGIRFVEAYGDVAIANTIILLAGIVTGGPSSGVGNLSSSYPLRVKHTSTSAGSDVFVSEYVAGQYRNIGGIVNASITAANGITRYGLLCKNPIGARFNNIQMAGGFTGACMAFQGTLNTFVSGARFINSTAIETPSAIRLLSGGGDIYGTTLTIKDCYVSGRLSPGAGGFSNVCFAEPAAGKEIVFDTTVYESINGIAFNICKGNQVIVKAPYCENVPNSDANIPMFEVGVTGGASPNNTYDSATSLVIEGEGGVLMQYSQGAATLTRLINADVAQYVEIRNAQIDRCLTLITGTNNTQQFRFGNLKSSSVTTVYSGLTNYKVFDQGGNVLAAAASFISHTSGSDAVRQSLPLGLYNNIDFYMSSDAGTEGRMSWFNKATGVFNSFRVKNGAAPTVRSWKRGDVVDNAFPSIGGAAGWSCTATGDAGTATFQMTGQSGVARGNTAARPTKTTMGVATDAAWAGAMFFDTTLATNGMPIWWTGLVWVKADGTVV